MSTTHRTVLHEGRELDFGAIKALICGMSVEDDRFLFSFRCPLTGALTTSWAQRSGEHAESDLHIEHPQVQAKAMEAWLKVAHVFTWDEVGQRLVGVGAPDVQVSPFARQMAWGPITKNETEHILAKLIAEALGALATQAPERRIYLERYAPRVEASLESLKASPVERSEVSGLSLPVRSTLYMVPCAIVWAEEVPGLKASAFLGRAADLLSLPQTQVAQLERFARLHVLEEILHAKASHLDVGSVTELQSRLRLSREDITGVWRRVRLQAAKTDEFETPLIIERDRVAKQRDRRMPEHKGAPSVFGG